MVNYKVPYNDVIEISGYRHIMQGNDKIYQLNNPTSGIQYLTFHKTADGIDYVVPAGKKAKIIVIEMWDAQGATQLIMYADAADVNTNAVTLFAPATTVAVVNIPFESINIPAGKYINWNDQATNFDQIPKIWVLEQDV